MEIRKYQSYKHLYVGKNDVFLLGYKFKVTKTEFLILKFLVNTSPYPVSSQLICEGCGTKISEKNLRFHISRINSKANIITNRKLIKNIAKNGYFLNEEM